MQIKIVILRDDTGARIMLGGDAGTDSGMFVGGIKRNAAGDYTIDTRGRIPEIDGLSGSTVREAAAAAKSRLDDVIIEME